MPPEQLEGISAVRRWRVRQGCSRPHRRVRRPFLNSDSFLWTWNKPIITIRLQTSSRTCRTDFCLSEQHICDSSLRPGDVSEAGRVTWTVRGRLDSGFKAPDLLPALPSCIPRLSFSVKTLLKTAVCLKSDRHDDNEHQGFGAPPRRDASHLRGLSSSFR